jgi:GT2 family glycosyltransferase
VKLSVIIVNYKTAGLVVDCLRSIYQFDSSQIEIIVVDNFSLDNLEHVLKVEFPDVKFIQMGYNSGFARANNAGIRIAEGDAILLLNSDTINLDNAIANCYTELMNSDYAACGVQLLNEDRTPQISGNNLMKGGLNFLLPLPYLGIMLKFVAGMMKVKRPSIAETTNTTEVDWVNGAYLMVKKSAIEKAGLMDEDFFLYSEETEWCSRIKKQGRICIFGKYNVVHLQGESSKSAFESAGKGYFNLFDKKGLQMMVSSFLRTRKELGLGWYFTHLFFYLITIPVFAVGLFFSKIFSKKKSGYSIIELKGFVANVRTILSLSGKMIKNKPYFYKML